MFLLGLRFSSSAESCGRSVDSPCSPLHQVQGGVSPSTGNASKTRASLPQATVEQNRRELVAFCQQCWQFTNFRYNKGEIGILPLMVRLLIDTYRTAEHQPDRLRGELTSQEIKKYVAMCLNPGKSTGPDRCPNELTKTMTDEEFQIVKMWVNEILTEGTSRQRATMNGTILQLHKGGGTNKTSDQRPGVLLNRAVYQLMNYVINERFKKNCPTSEHLRTRARWRQARTLRRH